MIVPVYNAEPYLAACADSLLAQTFASFEVLLIDDGSTDGSGEIAERYAQKDARVRVLRHRWNMGAAATYNTGLAISRGAYVTFVDGDDIVTSDCLETLYHELRLSGADMVAAGHQDFSEQPGDGNIMVRTREPAWLGRTVEDRLHAFLPMRVDIPPWSKLYRKSFLDMHRIAFASPGIAPDLTFHLECLLACDRYLVVPHVLYHYRVRPDSLEHAQGRERAARYAKVVPTLMTAFDAWARSDSVMEDEALRRKASQYLYLFLVMQLQNLTEACGKVEVYQLLRAAMEATPSRALVEAMTYAAVRIPLLVQDLDAE
ncbi:MAG: glycosyltransferase family 2 protein [Veillonellaceae bacterium]|nr:glycosyltransferase family 2 protein [Veillonellaceae bacterium]